MNRLQICDYERIEALAQKLTHARLEVRSRSAANILFKLKNGIFEADILVRTNCLSVLLDCIHEGIYKLLQDAPDDMLINGKEANHLLAQMLEIVRCVGMKSDTLLSIDKYSQILDKLYFISNLPNLDSRSSKFVNEVRFNSLDPIIFFGL